MVLNRSCSRCCGFGVVVVQVAVIGIGVNTLFSPTPNYFVLRFLSRSLLQIPVSKVRTYSDLRNVLMKRIFLSALHFRINTRYKVH